MSDTNTYPPTVPLDMGQLDSVTGGRNSFQEELLEMFFYNISECLTIMEKNCNDGDCDKWRDACDDLKSISDSLGALELSKICAVSEKIADASAKEKKKMLANIRSTVQKLRTFIKETRY